MRFLRLRESLRWLSALLICLAAGAHVVLASPGGEGAAPPPGEVSGATLNVPADHPTIQAALDAASSGDLVLVAPGFYVETLVITKAVTLASWFFTTGDASYIDSTILDGGDSGEVILIPAPTEAGATISGLTIQNADMGIRPQVKFNILHSRIQGTRDGIGYEEQSGGICRYNTIENNNDDGIDLDHDIDVVIEYNTIRNNGGDGIEARLQGYNGPTLHYVIRHNRIYGNEADGIQLIDHDSTLPTDRFFEISHNRIHDNLQAGLGLMGGGRTTETYEGASIREPIRVFHNSFVRNDHGMTGGDNAVVLNNLFLDNTVLGAKNIDGGSEVAFNLFFGNGTAHLGSNVDAATTLLADPLLDSDFVPIAGSPVIDAGTAFFVSNGETVLDLDPSQYSGSAPDLGACEFASVVGPPPDPPAPTEPLDTAVGVPLTPTLRWTGAGDVFRLQIATSATFADLVLDVAIPAGSTEHTVGVGVLQHETRYFWRVNASNAGGTSDWATRSFDTAAASAPPDPPSPSSPANGATDVALTPLLAWAGTADEFEVQLSTDSGFAVLVFAATVPTTSAAVAAGVLAQEASYFWRVAGRNGFGLGAWSATSSFTTLPPPDVIPPTTPENLHSTAQTPTTVALAWDSSPDTDLAAYNVYRDDTLIASESDPSHLATALLPNSPYGFQVSAVDDAGLESPRTPVHSVSTAALPQPVLVQVRVAAGDDDAEERISSGGSVSLSSSDLEMTEDGSKLQIVGIRFRNVAIPRGATILGAHVQFTVDESDAEETSLTFQGEASDNAAAFASSDGNLSSRLTTIGAVDWQPDPWTSRGVAGPAQRTPDLGALVQEVVDRGGWASGNALAFLVSGTGERTAESYDGEPDRAAVLEVEYAPEGSGGGPVPPPPPPSPTSPPDGSADASLEPLLAWTGTADDFEVQLATDADFAAPVFTATTAATSLAVAPGVLAEATRYYWRVAGSNSAGRGDFSSSFSFTTAAAPDPDPPPSDPVHISVRVVHDDDDAEERLSSGGSMSRSSSDLEMTEDGSRLQLVGIRFRNVEVPRGATILGARVQFTVDETGDAPTQLRIRGEASDDAAVFASADDDVSSRPTTSGFVDWEPSSWIRRGDAGAAQRTPDLGALLQEVVGREGWASGNALVLVVSGSGDRTAEAHDGDADAAPLLELDYVVGTTGP